MLTYNTMRFLTDTFNPYAKAALLVRKLGWDFGDNTQIDNFIVSGVEPDGTKRRFMFKHKDKVWKFNGSQLVEYTKDVTLDNVLEDGNTAAQFQAGGPVILDGKDIFPVIALSTDNIDLPSVKLQAKASNIVLNLINESEKMAMLHKTAPRQFLDLDYDTEITGNADAVVKVSLQDENKNWLDPVSVDAARGQSCYGVKLHITRSVAAVNGSNSAKVISPIKVHTSKDINFNVYGDNAWLYAVVKDYHLPLKDCVVVVRHEPLEGGIINAFVSYQGTRWTRTNIVLGTATGAEQSFTLEHDFFPSTLKIFVDGVQTTDFKFDTSDRSVTLTASKNAAVTANYSSNRKDEVWLPMTADAAQPTRNNLYTTRFRLKNPDDPAALNLTVSTIRLQLISTLNEKNYSATGSGSVQSVTLSHDPANIDFKVNGNFADYDYDDDTRKLSWTAPANSDVQLHYTWFSGKPVITGWSASWSA